MKVILQHSEESLWQQLGHEWYGKPVFPPFEFRFLLTEDALIFSARHPSPALLHPEARENHFQADLWRYDTAEFFIATADAGHYLEFNLAPNGAWWAAAFTAPRVVNPDVPPIPEGITATGRADAQGWTAELRIPLAGLHPMGIRPGKVPFRLAATAILNSPEQVFLTSATDTSGRPDFHQPWAWEEAQVGE